jgi:hypothetical protein
MGTRASLIKATNSPIDTGQTKKHGLPHEDLN